MFNKNDELLADECRKGKIKKYINDTIVFENISIDKLTDELAVKYCARGKGKDTWYNKNPKITIVFHK